MTTNILTYIHNNHTACILDDIKLPQNTKIDKIEDFSEFQYNLKANNVIMFGLSGNTDKRVKEEKIIQDVIELNKKYHPTFIIITPFSFESHTDLTYVFKKLDFLKQSKVDFEILELDELLQKTPNITFAQGYKQVQKHLETICSVKFGTFNG